MEKPPKINDTTELIFGVTDINFESVALKIFNSQYLNNAFYRNYCKALNIPVHAVDSLEKIPFLPIEFFKSRKIVTGDFEPALIFESSGTRGSTSSTHFVRDKEIYEESFLKTFSLFYTDPKKYCILGLLPSYLERKNSSLVYMVNELIKQSGHPAGGFYLYDTEKLYHTLLQNEKEQQSTLLIGVTYALLDFAEKYSMTPQNMIVMETGGMKGRREEMTREEVHLRLKERLGVSEIHSEYGMTELLSQAYSKQGGIFNCPSWMKILIRAEDDPFEVISAGRIQGNSATGAVNIIDLANVNSCSFIATDDIGKLYKNESFEISGRMDNSDTRGCGLMLL